MPQTNHTTNSDSSADTSPYDAELIELRKFATRAKEILVEVEAAAADEDFCDCSEREFLVAAVVDRIGDAGLQALARINVGPELVPGATPQRVEHQQKQARLLAMHIEGSLWSAATAGEAIEAIRAAIVSDNAMKAHRPDRQVGADVVEAAQTLVRLIEQVPAE